MNRAELPARPLRAWLRAWAMTTHDTPDMIARGFDLDTAFVADLLGPEPPRMVEVAVAREVCRKLRADPADLWRSDIAWVVGPCDWPTEPLWAEIDASVR